MATPKKALYIVADESAEPLEDGEMTETEALRRAKVHLSGNAHVFVYKAVFRAESAEPPVKVTKL